jgi:NIPSNAP
MQRRQFLSTTLGASLLASASAHGATQESSVSASSPSYYIWLTYTLRNGPMQKRMADFLRDALVPGLNRLGSSPVGVFEAMIGQQQPTTSVLMPFASIDALMAHEEKLAGDQEFQKAGDAYLKSPATDPAYVRRETSLLQAFANIPHIEVPAATKTKAPRMFELRMYESPSESAHAAKMSMFTKMGEMEIFRKVGLTPVFFGRTLIGARQPNFVYMLVHENLAAREKNWDNFRTNADWKTLASTPGFADADILTNITTTFLRPSAASQI